MTLKEIYEKLEKDMSNMTKEELYELGKYVDNLPKKKSMPFYKTWLGHKLGMFYAVMQEIERNDKKKG